jgi:hypothetical protein
MPVSQMIGLCDDAKVVTSTSTVADRVTAISTVSFR